MENGNFAPCRRLIRMGRYAAMGLDPGDLPMNDNIPENEPPNPEPTDVEIIMAIVRRFMKVYPWESLLKIAFTVRTFVKFGRLREQLEEDPTFLRRQRLARKLVRRAKLGKLVRRPRLRKLRRV
ncbi:hypothetical protein ACOMHN_000888 [Nucella lapillus]